MWLFYILKSTYFQAYSYKEQQEELQLRREIEERKRREGKIKEPQYTPKQLEIIKAQRDKEQVIRTRLTELNKVLKNCVSMIHSAAKGNPTALSLFYKELIPCILDACQSPLAAPYMTKLFIDLKSTIFEKHDTLSDLAAHVTLRLLQPQCDLDHAWEDESLSNSVSRTINLIYININKVKHLDNERYLTYFCAPGFCYIFPMLKMSLMSKHAKEDEFIIINGIKIISEHAKLRGSNVKGDKYHPKYLPRKQMLALLVELISKFLLLFYLEKRLAMSPHLARKKQNGIKIYMLKPLIKCFRVHM